MMVGRTRLPDTRPGATKKVTVNGWDVYITVNFYENDQPGELFIKVAKMGSMVSGWADMVALFASMLLQLGVPAEVVAKKLGHTRFEPHDQTYTSIADAVGKTLMELTSERGGQPSRNNQLEEVDW